MISWLALGVSAWFLWACKKHLVDRTCSRCTMSFMHVLYSVELQQQTGLPYRLLRYSNRRDDLDDLVQCRPVLFVPGNQGSYQQSRTIGSWLVQRNHELPGNVCYVVYTADLLEQWSVVSNRVVKQQASFIHDSMRFLQMRHPESFSGLVVLAHSMGSIVARQALNSSGMAATLVSLAAPFDAPVLDIDSRERIDYAAPLPAVEQMFISGGHADVQVQSGRSTGSRAAKVRFLDTETIPMVWASPDHQAIVWVHQVVDYLGRLVHASCK